MILRRPYMQKKSLLLGFLVLALLIVIPDSPVWAQYGKRAKRAALKTRNKQISRFTVRTDFSKSKKYISFGGGVGVTTYFGDLSPRSRRGSSDLSLMRSYLTGFYLHRVHPHITVRGGLTWMRLRGDDYSVSGISTPTADELGRFTRNLNFRNDVFEISGCGIFELFPTDRGYLRRNFLNPYGILGISLFYHNPKGMSPYEKGKNSEWIALQPLGTEGQNTGIPGTPKPYSLIQLGIPLGVGIRYRIADKWDLSLEFCYRFVFTDYIDDVSGKFPADSVYKKMLEQGNELGVRMSNRSGERYAAVDQEDRAAVFRSWKRPSTSKALIDQKGNSPFEKVAISYNDGEVYSMNRFDGMENSASPRGNKARDYWLNTAFHLAYILEIKQKPPKFR